MSDALWRDVRFMRRAQRTLEEFGIGADDVTELKIDVERLGLGGKRVVAADAVSRQVWAPVRGELSVAGDIYRSPWRNAVSPFAGVDRTELAQVFSIENPCTLHRIEVDLEDKSTTRIHRESLRTRRRSRGLDRCLAFRKDGVGSRVGTMVGGQSRWMTAGSRVQLRISTKEL